MHPHRLPLREGRHDLEHKVIGAAYETIVWDYLTARLVLTLGSQSKSDIVGHPATTLAIYIADNGIDSLIAALSRAKVELTKRPPPDI